MKHCSKCNTNKSTSDFPKDRRQRDGMKRYCKSCAYDMTIQWNRSPKGIAIRMWHKHIKRSIERGHSKPNYTREWLLDYVLNHDDFNRLYSDYVESGFDKYMSPSVDRLDDNIGYTKDNIRLVSFKDNMEHCYDAARKKEYINKGWDNDTLKPHMPVVQLTIDGKYVNEFISISEAARQIGSSSNGKISLVCKGKRKTHGGFKWMYLEDYEQHS